MKITENGYFGIIGIVCIGIFCVSSFIMYGCKEENKEEKMEIICNLNDKFEISLEENPTTGYTWILIYKSDEIELLNKQYSPSMPPAIGSGGTIKFVFQPKKYGNLCLKLEYKRPWEKKALKVEEYLIEVK